MVSLSPIRQYRVFLDTWNIWLTVLVTEQGMFYVLRELCDAVGIADARQQYQHLKAHESAAPFVDKLPVQTETRGRQRTYCIHQEILGEWLFMVNPSLMRQEFRPRLVDFKQKARRALNRIIFGEVDGTLAMIDGSARPGTITQLSDWLGKPDKPIELSPPEGDDTEE
jgi:hypothetical protein